MKKIFILPLFLVAFFAFVQTAPAQANRNCQAKEEAIERQLEQARSYGNTNRAAGLERALANVRRYCTDDSLRGRAEMEVVDKREEVLEREIELEEARAKGDAKKIAKREEKLREAREELAEAERELGRLSK